MVELTPKLVTVLERLPITESEVIRHAMIAVAEGPFIPEWEFSILMGVSRDEVREVISSWPRHAHDDDVTICAVKNSLVHLLSYPHGLGAELDSYVPGGTEAIERTLASLKSLGYGRIRRS